MLSQDQGIFPDGSWGQKRLSSTIVVDGGMRKIRRSPMKKAA
jgi:hypothetical protein